MAEQGSAGSPIAPPPVAWEAPPPDVGPAPGVEWAGYGARLVAYILDGLILGVVWIVAVIVFGGLFLSNFANGGRPGLGAAIGGSFLLLVFIFVVYIAYFPFFWARGGQTPGMRPFGIRVVRDKDGGRVTAGGAMLRLVGIWVSAFVLYIGFVWIFIDKRRRGWHDLIGGTVVIKDPPRR